MLLDTSGLFALHAIRETNHMQARTIFVAARRMLTHSYVLSEFVALAQARGLNRKSTMEYIVDIARHPDIRVVWVDQDLHEAACNLLLERLDKSYSLADAVSFVLMRRNSETEALTTDKHFVQEGFVRLLDPTG